MSQLAGQMNVWDCIEQAELESACAECPNPDICAEGGFCVEAALPDGARWDDPEALA